MSLFMPHKLVCIDSTKETAHFLDVALLVLLKDGRNVFLPKPISFLDNPSTCEGVDGEAICFKTCICFCQQV